MKFCLILCLVSYFCLCINQWELQACHLLLPTHDVSFISTWMTPYVTNIHRFPTYILSPSIVQETFKTTISVFWSLLRGLNIFHFIQMFYFWFNHNLGQKYYTPQVQPDWGSNSWPPDHDSTHHVTKTPALTTRPQKLFWAWQNMKKEWAEPNAMVSLSITPWLQIWRHLYCLYKHYCLMQ